MADHVPRICDSGFAGCCNAVHCNPKEKSKRNTTCHAHVYRRVGALVKNTASGSMALTRFRQLCAARVPTSRLQCDQSLLWNDKAIALRFARACSRSCLSDLMPDHTCASRHTDADPCFPKPQAQNRANAVRPVQGKAPYFSRGVILPRRRCLHA